MNSNGKVDPPSRFVVLFLHSYHPLPPKFYPQYCTPQVDASVDCHQRTSLRNTPDGSHMKYWRWALFGNNIVGVLDGINFIWRCRWRRRWRPWVCSLLSYFMVPRWQLCAHVAWIRKWWIIVHTLNFRWKGSMRTGEKGGRTTCPYENWSVLSSFVGRLRRPLFAAKVCEFAAALRNLQNFHFLPLGGVENSTKRAEYPKLPKVLVPR